MSNLTDYPWVRRVTLSETKPLKNIDHRESQKENHIYQPSILGDMLLVGAKLPPPTLLRTRTARHLVTLEDHPS